MSELRKEHAGEKRNSTSYGAITICEEAPDHLSNFKRVKIYWNAKKASLEDSNFIIKYLKTLKKEHKRGRLYEVVWYYQQDGDELMDMGWDLACLLDMRFVFKNYMRENLMTFAIGDYASFFKSSAGNY